MSRLAKYPITIPSGVDVTITDADVTVKGSKATLNRARHADVKIEAKDGALHFELLNKDNRPILGTMYSHVKNMIVGVTEGFQKDLKLIGTGYRAQLKGKLLDLQLGFSHPVNVDIPEGITVETPSQTEIIVKGADKEAVGQFADNIRSIRPVEPYKGKGVRYVNEHVIMKEAKKK